MKRHVTVVYSVLTFQLLHVHSKKSTYAQSPKITKFAKSYIHLGKKKMLNHLLITNAALAKC